MAHAQLLVWALAFTPQVFYWGSESPFLLTKAVYLHLLGALACLTVALRGTRQDFGYRLPRALLAPALFVGYAAARGPWGAEARPEIGAPFLWGAFLLAAWPTAAMAQTAAGGAARYARLLVVLGGATAGYALLQSLGFGLPLSPSGGRVVAASFSVGLGQPPFATLGNPNFLGEYLAPLLPLAVMGALADRGSAWATLQACSTALIVLALPLTLARGAWLAAFIGLGVALWLRPRLDPSGRGLSKLALVVLAAALVSIAAAEIWGQGSGPLGKVLGTFAQVRSAGEGRRLWWDAALRMVADHPLAGVGEGRFREAYPAYQAQVIASLPNPERVAVPAATVESPHNDFLQVVAELGLPGLLLVAGALLLILWDAAGAARLAEGPERALRAGCLGGLAALLLAGAFGYPLHTATGLWLLASLSALAVTPGPIAAATGPAPRWPWLILGAAAGLGLWHTASLLRVYAGSIHLHRGTEAMLRRDLPSALEAFERAQEVSPRDSQVRVALGRAHLARGRPDLALPHLQAGLRGFDGAPLRTLLGNAYALAGQKQAAEEVLRIGVAWFPGGYAPLHSSYGRLLAATGRPAEATRELQRAIEIDPRQGEAYYLLGHLRAQAGDSAGAAAALRRFLALAASSDPRAGPAEVLLGRLEEAPPRVDNPEKPVK